MDEILIEGKTYVSSKQAAKITGYAKDYVGQLCREGRVEARLVGRNWYVLEDSIREHRFGAPVEVKEEDLVNQSVAAPGLTRDWQVQYEAEMPAFVPDFVPKAPPASSPAIADMQSAWKEWFEEKKPAQNAEVNTIEDFEDVYTPILLPEAPEEAHEEEEVPIRVQKTYQAQEIAPETLLEETAVEVHRSYASMDQGERLPVSSIPVVDLSPRTRERREALVQEEVSAGGNGATRALIVVIAVVSVLIAIVGTGNVDRLLSGTSYNFGIQKAIVEYLGGTSIYDSSL